MLTVILHIQYISHYFVFVCLYTDVQSSTDYPATSGLCRCRKIKYADLTGTYTYMYSVYIYTVYIYIYIYIYIYTLTYTYIHTYIYCI